MDLRWFENLALSSKRSLHNFGTQVPAAIVNGAMDSHHLDDSRKVRNTEIHQELTNLPWFENLSLSSKRSLHNFGTRVPVAVVNGAMDSHYLDNSRKVIDTEIHQELTNLPWFENLALSSKRSPHNFGTQVPAAVVNGAIDSHHLDDSRK